MAKILAARMVYREGFECLDTMPPSAIAQLAVRYLHREAERNRLAEEVSSSALLNRDRISDELRRAGILAALA